MLADHDACVLRRQVAWYSAMTTWWLFGLLLSLKILLGRFDMRHLQAALSNRRRRLGSGGTGSDSGGYFDDYHTCSELHVDFMADCGDGCVCSHGCRRAGVYSRCVVSH